MKSKKVLFLFISLILFSAFTFIAIFIYNKNPDGFQKAYTFKDDAALIQINDKFGYINTSGEYLIRPKYEDGTSFNNGMALVKKDGFWGGIDKFGNTLMDFNFTEITKDNTLNPNSYIVKKNDKVGLIFNNKITIEPIFTHITNGPNVDLVRVNDGNKCGLMTYDGEIILEPIFHDIHSNYDSDIISVMIENYYVAFDLKTKKFFPQKSEKPFIFNSDISKIVKKNKMGFIDSNQNIIVEPRFDNLLPLTPDNIAAAKIDDKWGFINKSGELIIEPQYQEVVYSSIYAGFSGPLTILAKKDNKWGVIDSNGTILVNATHNFATPLTSELIGVSTDGSSWGVITKHGKLVANFNYSNLYPRGPDSIHANHHGKEVLISKNGVLFKNEKYTTVEQFNNNFLVKKDGKFGCVSSDNKKILETNYEDLSFYPDYIFSTLDYNLNYFHELFMNNFLYAKINNNYGVYDINGKVILEPKYSNIKYLNKDTFAVMENNLWGIINTSGKILVKPKFDEISEFNGDLIPVKMQEKWHYVNINGDLII